MKQLLASGLIALGVLAASNAVAQDTIRFAFTDIDGLEALQREMGPFKDAFEAASGLKVEFFPVSGRTVAVEAMAADQVDFVLTGPAEYVVFNARLKALPVVTWVRPDYYSTLVVLDASPVQTPVDLKGMKVSFGEIGSTSQHLGPVTLMSEAGLTYSVDYEPVFLNRNVAVEALIAEFAQDVKACALGQASAAILGQSVIGRSLPELQSAREALKAMLKDNGPVPAAPFDGYETLLPARDYKNRYASILLALEAVCEAMEAAQAAA